MAVRDIIFFPEHAKELREKSKPVPFVNNKVIRLIQDLKDTLKANADGIGLAAPQINIHKRVAVVCPGTEVDGEWQAGPPLAFVNPVIVESGDERRDFDGCLSFPGLYGEITRPHHLRVTGWSEGGIPFDRNFYGFNAFVIHHEIDHLDGILFIDRIENPQDLYTLQLEEDGNLVRVPVSLEHHRNPPDPVRFP